MNASELIAHINAALGNTPEAGEAARLIKLGATAAGEWSPADEAAFADQLAKAAKADHWKTDAELAAERVAQGGDGKDE